MEGQRAGIIRPYAPALVELNRVLDAGWILAALYAACVWNGIQWGAEQTTLSLMSVVIFGIAGTCWDLYRPWRVSPLWLELRRVWLSWTITSLVVVFLAFFLSLVPQTHDPTLLAWFVLGYLILGSVRIFVRVCLRWLRMRGRNFRTAAIIGATDMGARVAHNVRHTAWMGIRVIGFFDDRTPDPKRTRLRGVDLRGNIDDLLYLAREGGVDIIYITLPMSTELRIRDIMGRLSDTTASLYYVPDFSLFDLLHPSWDMLNNIPVVNLVDSPNNGLNGAIKRGFDIGLSLIILTVLLVPMLAIAARIRMTSPGPVIFRQQRYGLNGCNFEIWKFRTMSVCEEGDQFRQATRNDPRVTPFGAFLRRTSLDELPQFINVLQGHMAIVGPRPHPVVMNERQRKIIDRYMQRHKVKPGITGWAQVNGYRGETDTLEKIKQRIQLDLEYIDNWSIWLDMKIVLKTIRTVFKDANAY